jgi:5-(carboxyamino)imidazole ribonucleotide mutase
MQPALDIGKKAQYRVCLGAFFETDLELLVPTGELLAHFEVSSQRVLLGNCPGETPDLSQLMRKGGSSGVQIVILASRENGPARAIAASLAAPVIRVPVPMDGSPQSALAALSGDPGMDADEIPGAFAMVAVGEAGARNAALLAVSILALTDARLKAAWQAFRDEQTNAVLAQPAPRG